MVAKAQSAMITPNVSCQDKQVERLTTVPELVPSKEWPSPHKPTDELTGVMPQCQ